MKWADDLLSDYRHASEAFLIRLLTVLIEWNILEISLLASVQFGSATTSMGSVTFIWCICKSWNECRARPEARCQMPDARCQMLGALDSKIFGVICMFASLECCIIEYGFCLAGFCTVRPNVSFFLLNVEFRCFSIENWCLVGFTEWLEDGQSSSEIASNRVRLKINLNFGLPLR